MRRLILDLDTGIDDALALAYAIASHERGECELLAVTATYGNVTVERSLANTRTLLAVLGHPEIPVYAGPTRPGFAVLDVSAFIHGRNGVGEVCLPAAPAASPVTLGAVEFLAQAYRRYGADLLIVPTGPSTTIAQALRDFPELADAPIVFMGGALTVPGNVTAFAEANVYQDSAATDYLLQHGRDVSMVGLDVTLRTLLTCKETTQWRVSGTRTGQIFADMVDYYIDAYRTTSPHLGGCGLHDPLAVAAALDPSLVEWLPINLRCETGSGDKSEPDNGGARGRTIGDPRRLSTPCTTRVAVGVDVQRFLDEFMDRMEQCCRRD
ncbi:nucleoside hydrolase [Corynebacterium lizhenjunii]|uniref:Nucleoside hydrolase n=1 Tax=Corynebacterium lizhenjunii TaxID=2709394 RepID=A0A7T0KDB0_9CORY|nr:nucleoside hydrolase [Corynebacterium lizhenjunii]QPK78389.1 nucleoside hydrolase [Corynebacterium lizhenjunii]